jgi:hypothetical protein
MSPGPKDTSRNDVLNKILYLSTINFRFHRHACSRVISFAKLRGGDILFLESTLIYHNNVATTFCANKIMDSSTSIPFYIRFDKIQPPYRTGFVFIKWR